MRLTFKIVFYFFLIFWGSKSFAQDRYLDSLKLALKTEKADSNRIYILSALAETAGDDEWPQFNQSAMDLCETVLKKLEPNDPFFKTCKKLLANSIHNKAFLIRLQGNTEEALKLHNKGLKIMKEVGDKKGMVQTYSLIGGIYINKGKINEALELFKKGLKESLELNYKKGIAESKLNIGIVYQLQGNIPMALENYNKSLKIMEELDNKTNMAHILNNIGLIHFNQDDLPEALAYYFKSLKIYEAIKDNNGSATNYNNIALIYKKRKEHKKALDYFEKSFKTYALIPEQKGMAMSLNNQGSVYFLDGNYTAAIELHNQSLKKYTTIEDKSGVSQTLNCLATVYIKQKKYDKALELSLKGMALARQLGFPDLIKNAAFCLSTVYGHNRNFKAALQNHELYIQMGDSIVNEANRKASIRSQLKYEYEKKTSADSIAHIKEIEIQNIELDKQKAEIKVKRNQQFVLYGGLALVLTFSGIMYNRYKVITRQKVIIEEKEQQTQKQNLIILKQKELVEEKQREIIDSIKYAKRIQTALMTNENYITKSLGRLNSS